MLKTFTKYCENGFKLFPCRVTKAPDVKKGVDWRNSKVHITPDQAAARAYKKQFVGAWIPKNVIVIDIDNKPDAKKDDKKTGYTYFKELCGDQLLLDYDTLLALTFTVSTGSGGKHLFFTYDNDFSAGAKLCSSVDIKTHTGYVIAAGSNGYTIENDKKIAPLPDEIKNYILKKQDDRRKNPSKIIVNNPLSLERLQKILEQLEVKDFSTNDTWLEFIMSVIATCGNGQEVVDSLTEWSKKDERYKDDNSLRTRILSIEPDGGISPATFLDIMKRHNLSDYQRLQVRDEIGGTFQVSAQEEVELPFDIDEESIIYTQKDLVYDVFFNKGNTSGARLLHEIMKSLFIYVLGEKTFYFFDGNKWVKYYAVKDIIYTAIKKITDSIFLYMQNQGDCPPDIEDIRKSLLNRLQSTKWKRDTLDEYKELITVPSIQWDNNPGTLTFDDIVIDFTNKTLVHRKGKASEYRRSFIEIKEKELKAGETLYFDAMLENIFPDTETRESVLQALSMMVSGTSMHRVFQIWYGKGKNGKSTLIEVMKKVLGKRAITYDTNILMPARKSYGNSLTPELASFQGALAAFGSETEDGRKLSTGIVKNLCGGDTIKANPKHKDPIEFFATWQVVLATNYLPHFEALDAAFIDRLFVFPFETRFIDLADGEIINNYIYVREAEDTITLQQNILAERAQIILKLIREYCRLDKLTESDRMKNYKKSYVQHNDDINDFLSANYEIDTDSYVTYHELLERYREYTDNSRVSTRYVTDQILRLSPQFARAQKTIDGKSHRVLKGLKSKNSDIIEDF